MSSSYGGSGSTGDGHPPRRPQVHDTKRPPGGFAGNSYTDNTVRPTSSSGGNVPPYNHHHSHFKPSNDRNIRPQSYGTYPKGDTDPSSNKPYAASITTDNRHWEQQQNYHQRPGSNVDGKKRWSGDGEDRRGGGGRPPPPPPYRQSNYNGSNRSSFANDESSANLSNKSSILNGNPRSSSPYIGKNQFDRIEQQTGAGGASASITSRLGPSFSESNTQSSSTSSFYRPPPAAQFSDRQRWSSNSAENGDVNATEERGRRNIFRSATSNDPAHQPSTFVRGGGGYGSASKFNDDPPPSMRQHARPTNRFSSDYYKPNSISRPHQPADLSSFNHEDPRYSSRAGGNGATMNDGPRAYIPDSLANRDTNSMPAIPLYNSSSTAQGEVRISKSPTAHQTHHSSFRPASRGSLANEHRDPVIPVPENPQSSSSEFQPFSAARRRMSGSDPSPSSGGANDYHAPSSDRRNNSQPFFADTRSSDALPSQADGYVPAVGRGGRFSMPDKGRANRSSYSAPYPQRYARRSSILNPINPGDSELTSTRSRFNSDHPSLGLGLDLDASNSRRSSYPTRDSYRESAAPGGAYNKNYHDSTIPYAGRDGSRISPSPMTDDHSRPARFDDHPGKVIETFPPTQRYPDRPQKREYEPDMPDLFDARSRQPVDDGHRRREYPSYTQGTGAESNFRDGGYSGADKSFRGGSAYRGKSFRQAGTNRPTMLSQSSSGGHYEPRGSSSGDIGSNANIVNRKPSILGRNGTSSLFPPHPARGGSRHSGSYRGSNRSYPPNYTSKESAENPIDGARTEDSTTLLPSMNRDSSWRSYQSNRSDNSTPAQHNDQYSQRRYMTSGDRKPWQQRLPGVPHRSSPAGRRSIMDGESGRHSYPRRSDYDTRDDDDEGEEEDEDTELECDNQPSKQRLTSSRDKDLQSDDSRDSEVDDDAAEDQEEEDEDAIDQTKIEKQLNFVDNEISKYEALLKKLTLAEQSAKMSSTEEPTHGDVSGSPQSPDKSPTHPISNYADSSSSEVDLFSDDDDDDVVADALVAYNHEVPDVDDGLRHPYERRLQHRIVIKNKAQCAKVEAKYHAEMVKKELYYPVPFFFRPFGFDVVQNLAEEHRSRKSSLFKVLARRKAAELQHLSSVAADYEQRTVLWRKKQEEHINKAFIKKDILSPTLTGSNDQSTSGRASRRRDRFTSDVINSEEEYQKALRFLGVVPTEEGQESNADNGNPQASLPNLGEDPNRNARVPEMRLYCTASRPPAWYADHTGVVSNSVSILKAHNRSLDLCWSESEKEIFLSRVLEYGKNFDKISAHLPMKSTAECIQYYYREKIKLGLKRAIRKSLYGRNGRRRNNNAAMRRMNPEAVYQENLETAFSLLKQSADQPNHYMVSGHAPSGRSITPKILEKSSPAATPTGAAPVVEKTRKKPGPKPKVKPLAGELDPRSNTTTPIQDEEWTPEQCSIALEIFHANGKDWKLVASKIDKTEAQIRRFYNDTMKQRRPERAANTLATVSAPAAVVASDESSPPKVVAGPTTSTVVPIKTKGKPGRKPKVRPPEVVHPPVIVLLKSTAESTSASMPSAQELPVPAGRSTMADPEHRPEVNDPPMSAEDHQTPESMTSSPFGDQEADDDSGQISRKTVSYWSVAEKAEFLRALAKHGRVWDNIARVLGTKSGIQVRNYFYNFRVKLMLDRIIEENGHPNVDDKSDEHSSFYRRSIKNDKFPPSGNALVDPSDVAMDQDLDINKPHTSIPPIIIRRERPSVSIADITNPGGPGSESAGVIPSGRDPAGLDMDMDVSTEGTSSTELLESSRGLGGGNESGVTRTTNENEGEDVEMKDVV